jgi:hypothetical protein
LPLADFLEELVQDKPQSSNINVLSMADFKGSEAQYSEPASTVSKLDPSA